MVKFVRVVNAWARHTCSATSVLLQARPAYLAVCPFVKLHPRHQSQGFSQECVGDGQWRNREDRTHISQSASPLVRVGPKTESTHQDSYEERTPLATRTERCRTTPPLV